jgi:hypothetical protein
MRILVLVFCLVAACIAHAVPLDVYGTNLDLRDDCTLEITQRDGTSRIEPLVFENMGSCAFLKVSATSVPRVEFVEGDYVLLAESRRQSGAQCRGELAAVIVSRDGKVLAGTKTQPTGSCGYGERKDFEILRYHATLGLSSSGSLPVIGEPAVRSQRCAADAISRSVCMMALILDDIRTEFEGVDEGGISEIKATSTMTYTVSLPREERLQMLHYEFEIKDDTVSLKRRTETTQDF